jgi:hypothetical protein
MVCKPKSFNEPVLLFNEKCRIVWRDTFFYLSLHYDATMGTEYRGQYADRRVLGTDLFSGAEVR